MKGASLAGYRRFHLLYDYKVLLQYVNQTFLGGTSVCIRWLSKGNDLHIAETIPHWGATCHEATAKAHVWSPAVGPCYTHPKQGGKVQRGARLGWAKDSSMDETEVSQLRKGLVNSGSCSPAVLPAHLQFVRWGWALVSVGGQAPSLLQWEGTFWEAALALGGTDERSRCHAGKSLLKRTFCFCREPPAFK